MVAGWGLILADICCICIYVLIYGVCI
jgi:hypothetical protein